MTVLVAGVDSSTQSCKVVIVDALSGAVVRQGRASHPDGTSVDPSAWWDALLEAISMAGGLADVAGVAVGGQQHGMVALDDKGRVIRDALLWNDTRSAQAAADLTAEFGAEYWAEVTGSVPVASYTVTKLRWLATAEPDHAARVAAVALPHDWLTWRLAGYGPDGESPLGPDLTALVTDRSDASGTGYFNPVTNEYVRELLVAALGHDAVLPRVLGPSSPAGRLHASLGSALLGPGAGDNAAAALGLQMVAGDVAVSLGTSGVVSAVSDVAAHDASGLVSGFADASGRFLPLACTLNAAQVLDAACQVLRVDHAGLSRLAIEAQPGAGGLVLVPYLAGERTPNLPDATGSLLGVTVPNLTASNLARAHVEGMLCGLADALGAMVAQGLTPQRVVLIGGAARSEAVRTVAAQVFGREVLVPQGGEYVAMGAARQAAWVVSQDEQPPAWTRDDVTVAPTAGGEEILNRYRSACTLYLPR